ncbi:MraY family glycosyltransferase [Nonomuraea sp. NPDC005983]|uniref:MraY family glycosyltransferase n=1 Tax=Nonomuraea sp. NPDC005983 TaxID=3155595 RepID=UPI0033A3863B
MVISCTAIVPLRRLALHWDLTDRPSEKKAHARPTPYLGGLAITLGTLVPAVVAIGLADHRITVVLLAATAVALVGLIDDIRPLPAVTRLIVESVAASGVVLSGVHVTLMGGWLDGPVTVLWIVVLANSFNLLDNMDGALGSVATVTAAFLAATAFVAGQPSLGLLLTTLACAGLGFLPHNWAPARIFMGDSGSLFIGFVLSCSAVFLVAGQGADTTIAGLLLPTFVATVDTGVVFLSRMRVGRSPLAGGTDHVSHRLRRMGLRTRAVAATLGLSAAITGGLCLFTALHWIAPLVTTLVAGGTAVVLISLLQGVSVYVPAERLKAPPRIRERRR